MKRHCQFRATTTTAYRLNLPDEDSRRSSESFLVPEYGLQSRSADSYCFLQGEGGAPF